jgi:hypothetical protein
MLYAEMKKVENLQEKFDSFVLPALVCDVTTKELALSPEIDCDHTAMGLPPITPAVFLIAK